MGLLFFIFHYLTNKNGLNIENMKKDISSIEDVEQTDMNTTISFSSSNKSLNGEANSNTSIRRKVNSETAIKSYKKNSYKKK